MDAGAMCACVTFPVVPIAFSSSLDQTSLYLPCLVSCSRFKDRLCASGFDLSSLKDLPTDWTGQPSIANGLHWLASYLGDGLDP